MPDFSYTARRMDGSREQGAISAPSLAEAINALKGKQLFPIDVAQEKEAVSFAIGGVSGQTMAVFYGQLSSLLTSGVPLLKALKFWPSSPRTRS